MARKPEISRPALARQEYAALLDERAWWDAWFRDLSDYFQVRRSRFLASDANKPKRNSKNARNRALMAVRVARAGLMGGLMPQARPWFGLITPDPDLSKFRSVKPYLYDVQQIMFETFARTNIYDAAHESFGDDVVFGVSSLYVEDDDRDLIRGYVDPVGSFVVQNSARLEVDTWYKRTTLTVRQMVTRFGLSNCSEVVQSAWERNNYHQKFAVVHGVTPRSDREYGYRDAGQMPYASCWYEEAGNQDSYLLESGYNEFPVMVSRWEKTGEDAYGSPPAADALGAAMGLQKFEDRRLQALDKLVNPPTNAPRELRDMGGVTMLPGETNYYEGGPHNKVEPAILIDPRVFVEARNEIKDIEDQIDEALFYDLFLMIAKDDRSGITAEEIRAKKEERLLQVGPTIQRLQREKLSPLLHRSIAILERRGELPPKPPELENVPLSFEFLAPLAVAQRAVSTEALERSMAFGTNLSKFIPTVLDNIDADEAYTEYVKSIGAPPKTLRAKEDVAKLREDRAKADQMQQMAEAAKPLKDAATAVKIGAETQPVPGNPLERLAAQIPQPPASAPPSSVLPPGLSAVPGNAP